MATSLGIIGLLGLLANWLFSKIKLPGLLGMLIVGVLLGPYGFNLIDENLLAVSSDFRRIALIVILLRAGLGIKREDLNAVGITAAKMSFLPGIFEAIGLALASMWLFKFTWIQGGILGFILAAVSPAVIVPFMLHLQSLGLGAKRRVPTMILAAASVDDVVAITFFSACMGLYAASPVGQSWITLPLKILGIPVSIVLGALLGAAAGYILVQLFRRYHIRDTKKVIMLVGASILLTAIETVLQPYVAVASLLGVMAMGFVLVELKNEVAIRLSVKLNKVWVLAEILLFVLVGAQVNVHVALKAGTLGLLLILIGLSFRSLGVWVATYRSGFTLNERLFSILAFLPKATVQAAIGAIPLAAGVAGGELMLAIAVLSIMFTAPLGAILLNAFSFKLLK